MAYPRFRSRRALGLFVGLFLSLLDAASAEAAGFERTSPGARANGRAGADFAGGDSPMSLFYNPANLGVGTSTVRVEGALHLHFSERCFERVEVIENPDGTRSAGEVYPNLCADSGVGTIPELAASFRISDKLALGFGIFVPPAATRAMSFGNPETLRYDPDGMGEETDIAPTAFLLADQELLQLFLTFGASYEINPRFRVGASFGWGITKVDYASAAYSRVQVPVLLDLIDIQAQSVARTGLQATDAFVPRIQLGAWGQPIRDVPLELGMSFQWTQNIRTSNGRLNVRTVDTEVDDPWGSLVGGDIAGEATFDGVRLTTPQVSQLAFGIRYAKKLAQPADAVGDRLSTERFDIELGVVGTFSRRVDEFIVDLPEGAELVVPSPLPVVVDDIVAELPDEIRLQKRWRSQVAFRLGSDVSVIPGVFALRAGFSYETHGVTRGYEQLDFQPFRQMGIHLGATVRVAERVDFSLAYARIIQPAINLSVDEAQLRRNISGIATPEDAHIINAGRFTGSSNILIGQIGAAF